MKGRWTLAPLDYDSSRALRVTATDPDVLYGDEVPVVPCDDAAVERGAKAARDAYHHAIDARLLKDLWPAVAEAVLRAARDA